MGPARRTLLLVAALLSALVGVLAASHDHQDDAASVPCSVCLAAQSVDNAPPPAMPVFVSTPLPELVARTFALTLAVRPPLVMVPPGRAPPHAS